MDYDLLQSESITSIIPNLEIMKLATYYRIHENQFCRLLSLEDNDLSSYDKVYFFSETGHKLLVPDSFKGANNVVYGGTAFTNRIYIPFKNKIIDYTIPRISIYQEYLKEQYSNGIKDKVIIHALDDTYYRMYAGEKRLPIPAIKPKQRVYLFDRDFFYSDWLEIIQDISDRKPGGIYRIHPIVCHTLSEFFTARKCNKLVRNTEYIFDLNLPLEDLNYMFNHYKHLFLAEIVRSSNIFLPLKSDWITTEAYCNNMIYILNMLYAFWAKNIPIKIYFEEPLIGVINPFLELERTISSWTINVTTRHKEYTLLERLGKNKILLRQYKDFITKRPYAKTLFEQTYTEISKKGFWKV